MPPSTKPSLHVRVICRNVGLSRGGMDTTMGGTRTTRDYGMSRTDAEARLCAPRMCVVRADLATRCAQAISRSRQPKRYDGREVA